ncbi:MAG TPA: DUF6785 family protein [Tepidisphaeraceae bacterium]|nr:DUF6785 family protein [Tepidisphaeraceae bacterium]
MNDAPSPPALLPPRHRPSEPDVPPLAAGPQRAVTWRSVLLGLTGVVTICSLSFYNDFALNNTFLVGNNLPLGVVLLTFLFVVFVNGPLSRFAPRHALSGGELCVAFSMTLVACCLPGSGLWRYFPGSIVVPWYQARDNAEIRELLLSLDVPDWIYPRFAAPDRARWLSDPIAYGFVNRWIGPGAVPYAAWVRPVLTWGAFFAAMYGALLCVTLIVRRQWVENERLPFPLAQIQLSLIAAPPRGRWLNETMARRSFWIGFAAIAAVHVWNGCFRYWPQYVPEVPLNYDLAAVFSERPWSFTDGHVKKATIYFTAAGVTYFLAGPVGFSLWAFVLLDQAYKMVMGTTTGDTSKPGQSDQQFGGGIAFTLALLWVGRHHWADVARQAFRGRRAGEPAGAYASLAWAGRWLVVCLAGMVGWLWLAGCTVPGAIVMVAVLMMGFVLIGRIVAEVGLVHGQVHAPFYKPFQWAAMAGWGRPVPVETFYHSAVMQSVHYDFREVLTVYGLHGLKLADQALADAAARDRRRLVWCFVLALVVGYFVSGYATLRTEYAYAATLDESSQSPINKWGAFDNPRWGQLGPTLQYQKGDYHLNYNPAAHATFGFVFTGALSAMRLRYAAWPLHPIGFLMVGTFPGGALWFSIFLGWGFKTLVLRFGGAKLYADLKPLVIGVIVGEAVTAGFWAAAGIVLSQLGLPYKAIRVMPW